MRQRLLFCLLMLPCLITLGQCRSIGITGPDKMNVTLHYDQNERLTSMTGFNEDGQQSIQLTVNKNGLPVPVPQKGMKWTAGENGSYILTTGDDDDEGGMNSHIKFNKDGKIIAIDQGTEGGLKTTTYTYNSNGDLVKMEWKGNMMETGVTDRGELTATFNTVRPDVLMKGGPMLFMVEGHWLTFPMTNSHQITGYAYTQTIHMPERKVVTGKDKEGHEITKTIPAKDAKINISRSFSYTYTSSGMPASVTVTGNNVNRTFKFTYGDCK